MAGVQNVADPEQVESARQKGVFRERREISDLQHVLSTEQGRRFTWNLLSYCGVFQTSMTGDNFTYFREGMRQVGLKLMTEVTNHAPEAYLLMVKESKKEEDNA